MNEPINLKRLIKIISLNLYINTK